MTGVNWSIIATSFFTDGSGFGFDWTSPDDFGVVGEKIQVNDPDQEICWVSPVINIASAVGDVTVSVGQITQSGGLETAPNADFIKGEYRVNGGMWIQFGYLEGAFTTPNSFSVSGISGNTLEIRICAKTNGASEIITFDNVSVPNMGVSTGCNPPMVSIQTTQAGSCNNASGTIKVTANGGTPAYNVAWSGPSSGNPAGNEIAASGGMYTITSLTPGTYTITVTDAASCTATTTAAITTATALSLGTQVLNTTCSAVNDGEIDLTVNNGVPPYSYSWSNLPGSPDPQDQTGLAPGTYTVTVTDNAGCTASTSATISVSTPSAYLETFSIAGKGILDGSTCSGSNGTTCTNNNFAGVNWSIYGLSTLTGVDPNDYFKTTGGKLEHKDFDQDVCWESPEIDINPPGSGIAFSVDLAWNSFDQEPSSDYIDVEYSIDGGGWTRAPNAAGFSGTHTIGYINGSGNDISGSTTVTVTGLSGSTLRIRVCGLANSEDETFTIDNVSVPGSNGVYCPCPNITFTATPSNTCSGSSNGQIAVTGVAGGTGPYMYSKDNGATFQAGATFTGLAAGMYNVVVKDATGCVSASTQATVGTFSAPACTVTGPDYVCNNTENIVYSAPGGMSAYSWGISGNGSIPGSTTGASVSVTSGNFFTDYTVSVTVTDANGCTSSCSKQSFIYLQKPPADITANPNPVCQGAILDLSIFAAASSTVSWSGEGITNPSGNPSTTAIPTTTGPHVYSVMVTTNPAGCTNTGTVNVMVNVQPMPNCPADFSVCVDAAPFGLSGATPIGGTYSGTGVSANTFNPAAAGVGPHVITYGYTYINGCAGTCTFTITVNPRPVVSCPADFSVCVDAAPFALSGATPMGGTYSGAGVTANTFNPAAAGLGPHIITYNYTDGNGCTGSCTFTITVNPLPVVNCPADFSVCVDAAPFGLSGATPMGGTYSGAGVTANTFNPAAAGVGPHVITYTYTDGNGCTGSCTFTLTVNALPVVNCPSSFMECINTPAFALSGASPAGGTYSGAGVSNGIFNPAAAGAGPHIITYSYTDGNNCTNSCTFTITVAQAIPIDIVSSSTYCMDDPGPVIGLSSSMPGATYQLQTGGGANLGAPVMGTGGPIYFGIYPNGTYKVVATKGDCMNMETANVNANAGVCRIDVPNVCTCDGPNGYTAVTIKVSAPAGQNWEVVEVIGLYGPNPYPQVTVGTSLNYIGGDMYTLEVYRDNTKGYFVKISNGYTTKDIQVGNPSW